MPVSVEQVMRANVRSKDGRRSKQADAVALDNDGWVWGVILATAALTALCVAALFTVAAGG